MNPSSSHPLLLTEQCNWTGRSVVGLNVENERFTVACSRCRLAEYVKEFYLSACRTCSTIIFPHSTNQIVLSWRGVVAVAVVLSSAPFYVFTLERAFQIFVSTSETKFRPNCFHAACTNRPLETKLRLALVQPCLKCVCTASEVRVNRVKTHCGCWLGTVWTRFRRLLAASKLSVNRSNHVQLELRIVFI